MTSQSKILSALEAAYQVLLQPDQPGPFDGPTEVGTGVVEDEKVELFFSQSRGEALGV